MEEKYTHTDTLTQKVKINVLLLKNIKKMRICFQLGGRFGNAATCLDFRIKLAYHLHANHGTPLTSSLRALNGIKTGCSLEKHGAIKPAASTVTRSSHFRVDGENEKKKRTRALAQHEKNENI